MSGNDPSSIVPTNPPSTSREQEEPLGIYMIATSISIILSVFVTYIGLKFVDRFCKTDVDQDFIAMMMERFEAAQDDDAGRRNDAKTIFRGLTVEERRNVLEKVLIQQTQPFSKKVFEEMSIKKQILLTSLNKIEEGIQDTRTMMMQQHHDNDHNNNEEQQETNTATSVVNDINENTDSNKDPKVNDNNNNNSIAGSNMNNNQDSNQENKIPSWIPSIFTFTSNNNNNTTSNQSSKATTSPLSLSKQQYLHHHHQNQQNDECNKQQEIILIDDNKCPICLEEYEKSKKGKDNNTNITIGHTCPHIFHSNCILQWMATNHDFCPICRRYLFDVRKFKDVAMEELEKERFDDIVSKDDPNLVAMYMQRFQYDDHDIDEDVVFDGNVNMNVNATTTSTTNTTTPIPNNNNHISTV